LFEFPAGPPPDGGVATAPAPATARSLPAVDSGALAPEKTAGSVGMVGSVGMAAAAAAG